MLVYKGRSAFRARVSGRDGCGHTCNVARGQVVSVADVGLAAAIATAKAEAEATERAQVDAVAQDALPKRKMMPRPFAALVDALAFVAWR